MFDSGFKKVAGPVGRVINTAAKATGMGDDILARHRSGLAREIAGVRKHLRSGKDKAGTAIGFSGTSKKSIKSHVTVGRSGKPKAFDIESDS